MTTKTTEKIGKWLVSGKTGMSSLYLCAVYLGAKPEKVNWPHDPSDFARCLNFLSLVPHSHILLYKASQFDPKWKVIYDNWGILMGLWEREKWHEVKMELYDKMKELGL